MKLNLTRWGIDQETGMLHLRKRGGWSHCNTMRWSGHGVELPITVRLNHDGVFVSVSPLHCSECLLIEEKAGVLERRHHEACARLDEWYAPRDEVDAFLSTAASLRTNGTT